MVVEVATAAPPESAVSVMVKEPRVLAVAAGIGADRPAVAAHAPRAPSTHGADRSRRSRIRRNKAGYMAQMTADRKSFAARWTDHRLGYSIRTLDTRRSLSRL
jgi:hypothetical protein